MARRRPHGCSPRWSYAVDKKLKVADLRYERIDVVAGSLLTGIIGEVRRGHTTTVVLRPSDHNPRRG